MYLDIKKNQKSSTLPYLNTSCHLEWIRWLADGCESSSRLRCEQGAGGIMIWAEIIDG